MRRRPLPQSVLLLLFLVVLIPHYSASAGVVGKISGVVVDGEKDEPVVGASVRVVGTNLGTVTDDDGEYFIINVPSGKYDIVVSYVGFEPVTKKEVRVLVDLTTPLDFSLDSRAVELAQQVVVYAETPLIQQDLTASKVIFTSDRLKTLPNIITVQSVLTHYPGVVVDADNSLHVRGGRSGQVSYYYDGFSVQDPFVAQAGIRVIPSALEELSLTSGGFTAEYGEALSGVVSAVTPEGGSEYHGGLTFYEGATHPYNVNAGEWDKLSYLGNRSTSFNLSGPVPGFDSKRYTFFSAGEYLRNPTSLPHNEATSYTGTMKLAMQPIPRAKIKANGTYYSSDGAVYTHRDVNGRSYDFNTDGLPVFENEAYLVGLTNNFSLSERLVLSASASRFYTSSKRAPEHLFDTYWEDWPGYDENDNGDYEGSLHEENYLNDPDYTDPRQVIGFTVGEDYNPTYYERETQYDAFSVSVLTQLDKINEVKAGIEYRQYDIGWDFKQFYNRNPYGEKYTSKPKIASAYIQDKVEYDYFILNIGLRYDYRDADISYNATPWDTAASYKRAESRSRISPRLGVSFPITEKSVMHFNYGFYYQAPRFTYMYTNLKGDISSGLPLLGNPDLEPEQTVSYELGLDHLIGDDLRLDVTAYYKDIEELVTTRSSFQVAGNPVTHFDNDDYGSVKGIDFSLEKLPGGGYFSGAVAYSYMIAAGNGSTALEPYYTYITSTENNDPPITEYPLDFDQRHTVTAAVDFRVPPDWGGRLFGMPLPGAWGLNFVGHYGSGLPYTPTDSKGNPVGERNEGRLPGNYTVDMRFNKDIYLSRGRSMFTFFVEVDNLFNRHNVVDVYSRTGRADNDGRCAQAGLALDQAELDRLDQLYDHDPQNYSTPRAIRTGITFTF